MIIGLSGKEKSGKDFAAGIIQTLNPGYENKKFAGVLKEVAARMLNCPLEYFESQRIKNAKITGMDMTYREFLVDFGTDVVRGRYGEDFWVKRLFQEFTVFSSWVISDVRFPNEARAIQDEGGILIRLNRPDLKRKPLSQQPITETALDEWDFEFELNCYSGELEGMAKNLKDIMEDEDLLL